MALNVRVSLLTSLLFIGVLCWLVNEVGRPMAALPGPLLVGASGADRVFRAGMTGRGLPRGIASIRDRFERAAPVELEIERNPVPAGAVLLLTRSAEERMADGTEPLPRLSGSTISADAAPAFAGDGDALTYNSADVMFSEPRDEAVDVLVPEAVLAGVDTPRTELAESVSVETLQSADTEAEPPPPARGKKYVVRRGDSLIKILRREWSISDRRAIEAIVAANPKLRERQDRILVGEVLLIPEREAAIAALEQRIAAAVERPAEAAAPRPSPRKYTVRKSDTLVKIARVMLRDGRRWREIAKLNGLRDANRILPGTTILLPPVSGSDA